MSGQGAFVTEEHGEAGRAGALAHAAAVAPTAERVTPDRILDEDAPGASLPAPGARIGQYEIIRELGRGGMGAVYAARDTKLGRKVAIKLLSSSDHPELTARFILEARATARCSHENIIVIHEVGEHGGKPFMVLEYLQGVPLGRLVPEGKKLPPAQAVELVVPVVRALTVAHAHNIVHRDLKPDNIFVTDAGTIKVGGQVELRYSPRGAEVVFEGEYLGKSREHYVDVTVAGRPGARLGPASVYVLLGGGVNLLLSANGEDRSGVKEDITDGLRRSTSRC